MTTTLQRVGDDFALIFDRATLAELGVDEITEFLITPDDEGIFLKPIRFASDETVDVLDGTDHGGPRGDLAEARPMKPIFLTVDQVLRIQRQQLARDGGLPGVRDWNLLDSAAMQARMTFDRIFLHDDIFLMAAAYLFHLVKNHPFIDANKRVGLVTALLFLEINGFVVADPDGILYDTTIDVAEGKLGKGELAEVLRRLAVEVGLTPNLARRGAAEGVLMERVAVGLLGLGTVGSGVARLLVDQADRIARRVGRTVEVKWAAVRDPGGSASARSPSTGSSPSRGSSSTTPRSVVIEVMGGIDRAFDWTCQALASGKDVVTANKALLAERGAELFAVARQHGRAIAFEGAVGGGIPIVQALGVGLAANQVESIAAIVNGTCNFILTAMGRDGLPYDQALKQAQQLGYAEADPTMDVDGTDTAHKLAVLAQLAFGATVTTADIAREGIDRLQPADIAYAAELGYVVKLLALADLADGGLTLRVGPTLVKRGTPLADVQGPYNAVRVVGDAVGDTLFYGEGPAPCRPLRPSSAT